MYDWLVGDVIDDISERYWGISQFLIWHIWKVMRNFSIPHSLFTIYLDVSDDIMCGNVFDEVSVNIWVCIGVVIECGMWVFSVCCPRCSIIPTLFRTITMSFEIRRSYVQIHLSPSFPIKGVWLICFVEYGVRDSLVIIRIIILLLIPMGDGIQSVSTTRT